MTKSTARARPVSWRTDFSSVLLWRRAGWLSVCRAKGHFALLGVPTGRGPVGRAVCRAKWNFARLGVPSGRVPVGRAVCRAKWYFARLGVPSGRVAVRRAVCRAKWYFALFVCLHASLPIRTLLPGRHRKVFPKNFARLRRGRGGGLAAPPPLRFPPAFPEGQKPRNQKARIRASGHTGSRSCRSS